MADPAQAVSGGSPAQGAGSSAGTTNWEAEKQRYEQQLRGLSDERNRYKQQAEAWSRLGQEAGDAVKYDLATGLPVAWNVNDQPANQFGYAQVANPWQEVGVDANQVNSWYQQNFQTLAAQQGFVTQAQAQALANQAAAQAYQASNQRFLTQRSVDKVLSDPSYKDLSNPQSEWSKRTSAYLQQYQAGRPSREGAGWDEWDYTGPQVLQQAADITYAQMTREQQSANASQQQAIQNQQAAGLSGAVPGVASPANPLDEFDKIVQQGGNPLDLVRDMVNKDAAARGLT